MQTRTTEAYPRKKKPAYTATIEILCNQEELAKRLKKIVENYERGLDALDRKS